MHQGQVFRLKMQETTAGASRAAMQVLLLVIAVILAAAFLRLKTPHTSDVYGRALPLKNQASGLMASGGSTVQFGQDRGALRVVVVLEPFCPSEVRCGIFRYDAHQRRG